MKRQDDNGANEPMDWPTLLGEAERLRRSERFSEAIDQLDLLFEKAKAIGAKTWEARSMVERARNLLKLSDQEGAFLAVQAVPAEVIHANPSIDACVKLISGMAYRKLAHRTWKSGGDPASQLHAAFEMLEQAASLARSDLDRSAELDAMINNVYTRGLEAAVAGDSVNRNPKLLVELLPLLHESRNYTAPVDRDDATDLTIVADLAVGCEMSVADVFRLPGGELLGRSERHWDELLLDLTRVRSAPKSSLARALVLGSRCLVARYGPGKEAWARSYQIALHMSKLDVCTLNKSLEGELREAMRNVERAFDMPQLDKYVLR